MKNEYKLGNYPSLVEQESINNALDFIKKYGIAQAQTIVSKAPVDAEYQQGYPGGKFVRDVLPNDDLNTNTEFYRYKYSMWCKYTNGWLTDACICHQDSIDALVSVTSLKKAIHQYMGALRPKALNRQDSQHTEQGRAEYLAGTTNFKWLTKCDSSWEPLRSENIFNYPDNVACIERIEPLEAFVSAEAAKYVREVLWQLKQQAEAKPETDFWLGAKHYVDFALHSFGVFNPDELAPKAIQPDPTEVHVGSVVVFKEQIIGAKPWLHTVESFIEREVGKQEVCLGERDWEGNQCYYPIHYFRVASADERNAGQRIDVLTTHAVISKCQQYRYHLTRPGNAKHTKGPAVFLMLNPSTADASIDDQTIGRCRGFADALGYNGLIVANLYALRSTDPAGLWKHQDPVGPQNDYFLTVLARTHKTIICAWGRNAKAERVAEVVKLFKNEGCTLFCFGTNQNGSPKHPLYIKADTTLIKWNFDEQK